MTTCGGCGDCCESFPLNTPDRADIYGKRVLAESGTPKMAKMAGADRKQAAWMANLTPIGPPFRNKDGTWHWHYSCPIFDPVTRRCTDHANRPAVCRGYPHYGKDPVRYPGYDVDLSPRCTFNADRRTMLPIVEVR